MASPFELPTDRLATTTETGDRNYLYPAQVRGPLRTIRTYFYNALLLFFLILPWTKINGHQTILLDIPQRKFAIFGLTFWAHEVPILFLVLISFTLGILLISTLFGRVWCGWACPQTIFIDTVYRKIETWLEGEGLTQKRFNQKALSPQKVMIKLVKWSLFLAVSLLISHSFLAYFVGSNHIINLIENNPANNWSAFMAMGIMTGIVLFDFGWFREQFCIIACPYGRLQSVILDEESTVVSYDKNRSDCVNCYRCVQVCPTGIDIRRGTQMECIMCTACVDACNEVMVKSELPKNLIRFSSETKNNEKKTRHLRPRTITYSLLLTLTLSALILSISTRDMTPTFVKRQSNPPYETIENEMLRNEFNITIRNQYFKPIEATIQTNTKTPKNIRLIAPIKTLKIQEGTQETYTVFIEFPKALLKNGTAKIVLNKAIQHSDKPLEVTLSGPLS